MRRSVTPCSSALRQSRASYGSACQSRASGSASTFSISAASVTLRVIEPTCATVPKGDSGQAGTRPNEGLIPKSPVKLQGMRIEPPPSVPTASAPMPEASAAAAPPEEPPGVFFGIELVDALEHRARHFDRRELVLSVSVEQLGRAQRAEIARLFC